MVANIMIHIIILLNKDMMLSMLDGQGEWLDLKQLNPDYVFHSRPYNNFMPKPYTSKQFKNIH